jgi:hypothetical protein
MSLSQLLVKLAVSNSGDERIDDRRLSKAHARFTRAFEGPLPEHRGSLRPLPIRPRSPRASASHWTLRPSHREIPSPLFWRRRQSVGYSPISGCTRLRALTIPTNADTDCCVLAQWAARPANREPKCCLCVNQPVQFAQPASPIRWPEPTDTVPCCYRDGPPHHRPPLGLDKEALAHTRFALHPIHRAGLAAPYRDF